MTLYTRHGFVITEGEGDEERPPVHRCGGIGWCEEDSADYLAWRRTKTLTATGERLDTLEIQKNLNHLSTATTYMHDGTIEYQRGFYDAIRIVRGITQADPSILKALKAFQR